MSADIRRIRRGLYQARCLECPDATNPTRKARAKEWANQHNEDHHKAPETSGTYDFKGTK